MVKVHWKVSESKRQSNSRRISLCDFFFLLSLFICTKVEHNSSLYHIPELEYGSEKNLGFSEPNLVVKTGRIFQLYMQRRNNYEIHLLDLSLYYLVGS